MARSREQTPFENHRSLDACSSCGSSPRREGELTVRNPGAMKITDDRLSLVWDDGKWNARPGGRRLLGLGFDAPYEPIWD